MEVVDYYTGCVGEPIEGKNEREVLRMLHWETNEVISKSTTAVTSLVLHPVRKSCGANCYYCYVGSNNLGIKKDDYLTMDVLKEKMQAIREYNDSICANNEIIYVKITGGEPLLNEELFNFLKYLDEEIDNKFYVTLYTSLYVPKKTYEMFKDMLMRLDEFTNMQKFHVFYSINFGNANDLGKVIKGEPRDFRINELIDMRVEHNLDRLFFTLHNVITSETSVPEFFTELDSYLPKYEDFIDVTFTLVKEKQFLPKLAVFRDFVERIEKLAYEPYITFWALVHLNRKFNSNDGSTLFYEVEDGTYKWSPFNSYCGMFKSSMVIDAAGFCSCFHKVAEADTVEEAMNVENYPNDQKMTEFFTLPDQCIDCDVFSFCNRCRLDRNVLKCSEQYKEFERLRFRLFSKQVIEYINTQKES